MNDLEIIIKAAKNTAAAAKRHGDHQASRVFTSFAKNLGRLKQQQADEQTTHEYSETPGWVRTTGTGDDEIPF